MLTPSRCIRSFTARHNALPFTKTSQSFKWRKPLTIPDEWASLSDTINQKKVVHV